MSPRLPLVFLFLIVAAGLAQNSGFNIYGVEPNLVMAVILVFGAFCSSWIWRLIFIVFGLLSLSVGSALGVELIYFSAAVIVSLFIMDRLPWFTVINIIVSSVAGTLIFNFLLSLPGLNPNFYSWILEAFYNVAISLALFFLCFFIIEDRNMSLKNS